MKRDVVPSYKWRGVGFMSHEQADVVMIVMNTSHTCMYNNDL